MTRAERSHLVELYIDNTHSAYKIAQQVLDCYPHISVEFKARILQGRLPKHTGDCRVTLTALRDWVTGELKERAYQQAMNSRLPAGHQEEP